MKVGHTRTYSLFHTHTRSPAWTEKLQPCIHTLTCVAVVFISFFLAYLLKDFFQSISLSFKTLFYSLSVCVCLTVFVCAWRLLLLGFVPLYASICLDQFQVDTLWGRDDFLWFFFFLFFSFLTVFLESNNILKVRRFKELNFEQLWEFLDCLFCQMVKFWEKWAQVNVYIYGCTWEVNKKKSEWV